MKGELVKIETKDGFELDGFCSRAKNSSNNCVIHFHGLAGNFYENRFIINISNVLIQNGINFITANNRGHDYITDVLQQKKETISYVKGGAAFEVFEYFIQDAEGWISYAIKQGFRQIILQGHSSGALKILYYQTQQQDPSIKALLLLSPSDDIEVHKKELGDQFEESIAIANQMVISGKQHDLMPSELYDMPISAKTYLNMFATGTNNLINVKDIRCPILAIIGSEDPYTVRDPGNHLIQIKNQATKSEFVEIHVIDKANHVYTRREEILAELIVEFLGKYFRG